MIQENYEDSLFVLKVHSINMLWYTFMEKCGGNVQMNHESVTKIMTDAIFILVVNLCSRGFQANT